MKSRQKLHRRLNVTQIVLIVLVINVIVLDVIIARNISNNAMVLGTSTSDPCPQACIARINQVAGSSTRAATKENYVPLGSGTNATDEWTDVAGASASVDTAAYGKIKQVTFEATVAIPAGSQRVWVRLFNATDKHPVWYSELTTDSAAPQLLTSSPISLDQGNKVYQVQMKTQLKALTTLVQSRLRIVSY